MKYKSAASQNTEHFGWKKIVGPFVPHEIDMSMRCVSDAVAHYPREWWTFNLPGLIPSVERKSRNQVTQFVKSISAV